MRGALPLQPVADPGDQGGPKDPVKYVIKKMAAEGSHIDFMFLPPLTQPLDLLLATPINHYLGSNACKKRNHISKAKPYLNISKTSFLG